MKTFQRAFVYFSAISIACGYAAEIKVGDNMDQVATLMQKAKYQETAMQTALQPNTSEKSWKVGEGELVVEYSLTNNHVFNMYYFVEDERSKILRRTFTFQVVSFDPESRRMVIAIKR